MASANSNSRSYGEMTIPQLKEELRKRKAKLSGKKHQLIERLESYDRNENFGQTLDREIFNMSVPDSSCYSDINSDTKMPSITEEKVQTYLKIFGQDLRAKSQDMYHGKFLRSVRLAATESDVVYICGRVSAEMVKKCVYSVDLKIDQHGVVMESQCECAAGMGPDAHCKHVALVLYALTKVKTGLITMETCTQTLQTFHQAKKYTGSPVKLQDISLRPTVATKNKGLAALKDFDPRPIQDRKVPGYRDFFRSVWLNSSAPNPPIRHLYSPANVYGIVNDHDYLAEHPEELFLGSIGVTKITADQRAMVEQQTRGQGSSKAWKEERLIRLQASMYGRICMATDRTDFPKLAHSLTIFKDVSSDAIKHGRKYEPTARDAYAKEAKVTVTESGIVVCECTPYLGCSPDGLVDKDGILEVKCPYTACNDVISPQTVPYLKLDDGRMTLQSNHAYYYQVMGTLLCTDRKWCDFVVWSMKGFQVIRISRDEEFISAMRAKLTEFFKNHFRQALLEKFMYRHTHTFV